MVNHDRGDAPRTILVTSAQGVSGRAVVEQYSQLSHTKVYGLSRRPLPATDGVEHVSVDLLDVEDIEAKLWNITNVTHLFFGVYIDKADAKEKATPTWSF